MYIALTENELEALRGRDYSLTVLYIYLKQFMDYRTGIVGLARRISYQSLSEALYIDPRQGVKGGAPHVSAIRRMLDQLIKYGIIRKGDQETLVFKLPLADTENYVQIKADKKPTRKADSMKASKQKAYSDNADIPKTPKADTPHLSLNIINNNTAAATQTEKSTENTKNAAAAANYKFHKSINTEAQQFMLNASKDFDDTQKQVLFDELAGFIQKGKVKSNLMGLFITFIGQVKSGLFVPVYADWVKNLRENPPAEKPKAATQEQLDQQRQAAKERRSQILESKGTLIDFLNAKKGVKTA